MPALAPAVGAKVANDVNAKRLSIVLTDNAYSEVANLSKSTRRSITELVRLGLGLVKILVEEVGRGNKLVVATKDGQPLKEIVLPM